MKNTPKTISDFRLHIINLDLHFIGSLKPKFTLNKSKGIKVLFYRHYTY